MNSKLLLCLALALSGLLNHDAYAAIIFPKAPEEGRQIAYEKVSRVLEAFPHAFNGLKMDELTITDSHKMYAVGRQDIISGNLLSAVKFSGWDYLFMHGTNAIFAVPVLFSLKDGKTLKAGAVSGEGFADPILEALRKAEALSQSKQQDYEPRYLSMGMSFSAVWLHGKTNDIIIPLTPGGGEWKAYQPYSEEQIAKLVKPVAEDELKNSDGAGMEPTLKGPIPVEKFDPFERKTKP